MSAIAKYFGFALLLLSGAMLAPALFGAFAGEPNTGNYVFAAAAASFFGGGLSLLAGKNDAAADFRSTLVLIFLWWAAAPIFCALPFLLGGWNLVDAYFEAVSALTTTGATLKEGDLIVEPADFLWRAVLQWIGGLSSLAIAAAIFIRPVFVGANTLLPTYTRGEKDSYVHAIAYAARAFGPPYAAITAMLFIGLALTGAPGLEAAAIAMSTAASGGLSPYADGISVYGAGVSFLIFPFLLLSGVNFVLVERTGRGDFTSLRDSETATFLALILAVAAAAYAMPGQGSVGASLFNAASLFSTNGITIGEPPGLIFALVTVIVGGCAVSTAGGLKILRWIVIMRRAQMEIRRLIVPSGVFGQANAGNELGVWMHFLVFTIVLGILTATVTAGGQSLETAAAGAVAVLANAGPVISLTEQGAEGFRIFDDAAVRLALAAGMILGRLEGVAALMLINRAFWRG